MRLLWSCPLPAPPLGMSLAREPGTILVWDTEGMLGRYDRAGQRVLRQRAPGSLALAAHADDGQSLAVASKHGRVWLLTAELAPIWENSLPHRPTALALDHKGKQLAVADEAGGLYVFGRADQIIWQATTARPLAHLAFVPEAPVLVGCAEFGLVTAFDAKGATLWRDGLVAHVGSLAVTGAGDRIVLACFTEGLACYALSGNRLPGKPSAAPARMAALSYTGAAVLTVGLGQDVTWRDAAGAVQGEMTLPASPVAVALEPLGRSAVAVLSSGEIVCLSLWGDSAL